MSSMKVNTLIEVQLGGQLVRLETESLRTVGEEVLERIVILDDAGGQETLFSSAADVYAAGWTIGVIQVDPDDEYADNAAEPVVAIDFVGDAVASPAILVRREALFIFASSSAGAALALIDGAITQIRAINNNAAPASGNADVTVRIALFK